MLEIKRFTLTPFQQNTRLVICAKSRDAVLIDPGGESEVLLPEIEKANVSLKQIWLTHAHLDHCGAVSKILETYKVDLLGHPVESLMRANVQNVAAMYGIPGGYFDNCPEPNIFIQGGETLSVGENKFKVLFTPGHSPGHVSFYCAEQQIVISGDVLFAGSIGRTDLPGGDHGQLIASVEEQIFTLPPETKVLSGHGEDTTVGREIAHNPFFNGEI